MASVDWLKIKTVEKMKGMIGHDDKEHRLTQNHENEHINKKLTPYNLQDCSYSEACERYDKRMEFLDSQPNANKKCNRVLGIGLNIPIPSGIPDNKVQEYTDKVNNIIKDMFGAENFIASFTHVDEIHDYIDSETKKWRTSMRHIHDIVLPVKDSKLNCDLIFRRGNMKKLNKTIHEMTLKDYGVEFMDGSKKKSLDEVETLKNKSLKLENEELQGENAELKRTRKQLRADIEQKRSELVQIQAEINQGQNDKNELQRQLQAVQEQLRKLQEEKEDYLAFRAERRKKQEKHEQQMQKLSNVFGEAVNIHSHTKCSGRHDDLEA